MRKKAIGTKIFRVLPIMNVKYQWTGGNLGFENVSESIGYEIKWISIWFQMTKKWFLKQKIILIHLTFCLFALLNINGHQIFHSQIKSGENSQQQKYAKNYQWLRDLKQMLKNME